MKKLITLSAMVLTMASCSKNEPLMYPELDCPPYDATFLNTWFPYEQGSTYYYKDEGSNTRQWMEIANVVHSDGDDISECFVEDKCHPYGYIFASRDLEQPDKITCSINHYRTDGEESLSLSFNSPATELSVQSDGTLILNDLYYGRSEQYYADIKPDVTHHQQLQLKDATYTDVYEFVYPYTGQGETKVLYLAKGYGIVAYETFDGRKFYIQ